MGRILLGALGAGWLAGCVSPAVLVAERDALKNQIEDARGRERCKPEDLAVAEANLVFAEVEFDEGDLARASQHLDVGRDVIRSALLCPVKAAPLPPALPPEPQAEPEPPPKPVAAASPVDTDGDGVTDDLDRCPEDPEDLDAFKDSDGCPDLDNDGDGVLDARDRCPLDAEDRDKFEDQDGCPDPDNDGDGLADGLDRCPNEPGRGSLDGCPVKDQDFDGIDDVADRCPTVPETKNGYLDDDGCPDTKPTRVEITAEQIVIKQRINFATGKATILADSFGVLDDVAQVMRDYPKVRVEIGGHTDNVGDDNQNQRLSKGRADAVFEYLLQKGIAANRMVTIGYGETRPIDTNRTDAGKLNNRRVEFMIVQGNPGDPAPEAPRVPPQEEPSPWR
jgi:outer membrane protein OmpA-like peptidoglycan-associated protein